MAETTVAKNGAKEEEYTKNARPSTQTLEVDPAELLVESMPKADFLKALEQAETLKKDQFQDLEADFWKGEKNGDFIQGVYAGYEKGRKYLVHAVIKKDTKGKPYAVRINGTAVLTRALKQVDPGTPVRIERTGQDKNENGDPVFLYSVQTPKQRL